MSARSGAERQAVEQGFDIFEWRRANTLLQGIPPIMKDEDMRLALRYDPRDAWTQPPTSYADLLKEAWRIRSRFEPTEYCVKLGARILLAMHIELEKKDPRIVDSRKENYSRGSCAAKSLAEIPWEASGAPGFILEGSSGESKSMFAERLTHLIQQVIQHPARPELGWLAFTQVTWLRVPMPTLRSIKGFIMEMAHELDKAAGTDYASQLHSKSSTDKQLVSLLIWMNLHKVILLTIEESQEESLGGSVIAKELLLFFLKTLNWGIIVLLVGNPNALSVVKSFCQDNRRFTDGGTYTVLPVLHWTDPEWSEQLVPNIWGYNVLPNDDEPIKNRDQFLYLATGGQRYALARLRRESLLAAISDGSPRVLKTHVMQARNSPPMKALWKLINALVIRDEGALRDISDFPTDAIMAEWELHPVAEDASG